MDVPDSIFDALTGSAAAGSNSGVALPLQAEERCRQYFSAKKPSTTCAESMNDLELSIKKRTMNYPYTQPRGRMEMLRTLSLGGNVTHAMVMNDMIPLTPHLVAESRSRVYGARFVGKNGSTFVSSSQERKLCVYDTGNSPKRKDWKKTHTINAYDVQWTITDFDVSPDGNFLAYASITKLVHVVDLRDTSSPQAVLDFSFSNDIHIVIWSLKWSPDSSKIIVGTGASHFHSYHIIVYDIFSQTVMKAIPAHEDDVNSICYLQNDDHNLLLSASDDAFVKMWDLRQTRARYNHRESGVPAAMFVGHQLGLTCVSSKDDGRYFISNGKDQFIKLWDIRRSTSPSDLKSVRLPPRQYFDYRMENSPPTLSVRDFHDDCVKTYRGGHQTLQTLMRAHFSPAHTTGQRYIYCGSNDGACVIYDVLTGDVACRLHSHSRAVRDVSWHPYSECLTTGSWDGRIMLWTPYTANAIDQDQEDDIVSPDNEHVFSSLFAIRSRRWFLRHLIEE